MDTPDTTEPDLDALIDQFAASVGEFIRLQLEVTLAELNRRTTLEGQPSDDH